MVVCPVYLSERIYQQDNPCQTKIGVVEEGSSSDSLFFFAFGSRADEVGFMFSHNDVTVWFTADTTSMCFRQNVEMLRLGYFH